jgi:amidohydrolase
VGGSGFQSFKGKSEKTGCAQFLLFSQIVLFLSKTERKLQHPDEIKEAVAALKQMLVKIRRHLHAHPELSFQEKETAAFISGQLTSWGMEHQTQVAGYGITGLIKGKNPDKKVVALRADIDALPIVENSVKEYKSQNHGVMHACGHDVHTTCLLGALKLLHERKHTFEGTVKYLFQPAEEKLPG